MKAKKFAALCKKLTKETKTNRYYESYAKFFFRETGNVEFCRFFDAIDAIVSSLRFTERKFPEQKHLEDILEYVGNYFSDLAVEKYLKTFSKEQIKELKKIREVEFLHHDDRKPFDLEKFWEEFYFVFLNDPHGKEDDYFDEIYDNGTKELIEGKIFRNEWEHFEALADSFDHPLANSLKIAVKVENEVNGTNVLQKEFVKRLQNVFRKALEDKFPFKGRDYENPKVRPQKESKEVDYTLFCEEMGISVEELKKELENAEWQSF